MRTVRFVGMLLVCAAVASSGVSMATAQAPRALTRLEYLQLRLAQQRVRSLRPASPRGLATASAVCSRMHDVSALITAVRKGCLDLIRLGGDDARLSARATRCGIDPPSAMAILSCLLPAIQRYSTDAEAFYRSQSQVDRLARARGLSRWCVAVLGDSPANLAAEGRLAADLREAVQALRNRNPEALPTLSDQIQTAVKTIRPGPRSLSRCPHR